jgi:hypothetical protein
MRIIGELEVNIPFQFYAGSTKLPAGNYVVHMLNNFGGGWRWGGIGDATTTTETYRVGTLVIDLFDTNTKKLVWRGSASDTLSNKSEKNIDNLDKGVEKMFKKFPPEPPKK